MDAAHLHLLLNHVPVLGTVFGLGLLTCGRLRDGDELVKAGLATLALVGAASVVVYLTGEPAEELVEGVAGVSRAALEAHEEAALWATWASGLLGALSLGGLWLYRRSSPDRALVSVTLVLAVVVTGLMAWTARSGGKVHHPELRGGPTAEGQAAAEGEGPGTTGEEGAAAGEEDGAGEEP